MLVMQGKVILLLIFFTHFFIYILYSRIWTLLRALVVFTHILDLFFRPTYGSNSIIACQSFVTCTFTLSVIAST